MLPYALDNRCKWGPSSTRPPRVLHSEGLTLGIHELLSAFGLLRSTPGFGQGVVR